MCVETNIDEQLKQQTKQRLFVDITCSEDQFVNFLRSKLEMNIIEANNRELPELEKQ